MSASTQENQGLTPIQLHLLKVFRYDRDEKHMEEIRDLLLDYYSKKLDELSEKLWDEGVLNQEKLDQYRKMHIRDILKDE